MRTLHCVITFFFFLGSCTREAYPEEKYHIPKNIRDLVSCYKVGDTLIFKSSTNLIDSFVISGIDSQTNNSKGLFMNPRNSKEISVYYRQIPIDKWQEHWIEMGSNNEERKERSRDASLISIVKYPDDQSISYRYNFKEFRCSKNEVPQLFTDSVEIGKYKFSNYYKIENCSFNSDYPNSIKTCYSSTNLGLVAFITVDKTYWTRQN